VRGAEPADVAPVLAVGREDLVLEAVREDLGGAEVRARGEGAVVLAHERRRGGRGGGDQRGDLAEAEAQEVGRAVRRGERAEGAVRERAHLVQVADQRQAPRRWRQAPRVPAGGAGLAEAEEANEEEREEKKQGRELHQYLTKTQVMKLNRVRDRRGAFWSSSLVGPTCQGILTV